MLRDYQCHEGCARSVTMFRHVNKISQQWDQTNYPLLPMHISEPHDLVTGSVVVLPWTIFAAYGEPPTSSAVFRDPVI